MSTRRDMQDQTAEVRHRPSPKGGRFPQIRKDEHRRPPRTCGHSTSRILLSKHDKMQLFETNRREIITSLGNIELALQGYYNSIVEQIILKNTDGNLLIEEAIERTAHPFK